MESKLQIFFVVAILFYLVSIIHLLRKKKLNLKYTLLWLICSIVLLVVIIFPDGIVFLSGLIGIKTPINGALVLASMFIIMILVMLTSIVSQLNHKLRVLCQENALLEERIRKLENQHSESNKVDNE